MEQLDNLHQQLKNTTGKKSLPPVDKWNPPLSGDMDLIIKSNGEWWHEGRPIERESLIRLFSTILKKEADDYFLVSPVEKWRIQVEDAPFLVTHVSITEGGIEFITNADDSFLLSDEHPLKIEKRANDSRPYVLVRKNLYALLGRNVYYTLAERAIKKMVCTVLKVRIGFLL